VRAVLAGNGAPPHLNGTNGTPAALPAEIRSAKN
jgi:hypothetical protein